MAAHINVFVASGVIHSSIQMSLFDPLTKQAKISDVFTPRRSEVNPKTYVPRPDLEQALIRSIQGSMHSILFGESGNGKSWLYMKTLRQVGYHYKVANCANASRIGTLTDEIYNCVVPTGQPKKKSYSESKEASINAIAAEGKISHQGNFDIQTDEPLLAALKTFRRDIGNHGDGILVLDNLESIFKNEKLMGELADIIILLDDARYAKTRIKILIVGVPNGVLEYFARTKNLESVSNRLEELPKVGGMNLAMTKTLVKVGFNDLLRYDLGSDMISQISTHIHGVTLGIAQRIHEYCEKLAYEIEDNNKRYTSELLEKADKNWLRLGLRQAYTVVESHLNAKKTTIARRNQVVYCIGKVNSHQIDSAKISELIRDEFPNNSKDTDMGVGSILSELASGDNPLLTKNPKTSQYRIADPRYLMCIRTILQKDKDANIKKANFKIQ